MGRLKSGSSHDWRRYGELRRQLLVEQDEANTSFYLNPSCPMTRYFELAERVRLDRAKEDLECWSKSNNFSRLVTLDRLSTSFGSNARRA
jgi:hypothetical protein